MNKIGSAVAIGGSLAALAVNVLSAILDKKSRIDQTGGADEANDSPDSDNTDVAEVPTEEVTKEE